MVLWCDVHRRYMWWIMIQIGEQWYSLYSELHLTDAQNIEYINLKVIVNTASKTKTCKVNSIAYNVNFVIPSSDRH